MSLILTTKRLILTPFEKQDHSLFHQINTDAFVRKYLWDDEIITKETSKEILEVNEKQFKDENCGLWKISDKESEEIIGYSGLWYFFEETQPQLLYALLKQYTGQGYAIEASNAVMKYAFENLDFESLIAASDEKNESSHRVATRLGMEIFKQENVDGKLTTFYKLNRKAT